MAVHTPAEARSPKEHASHDPGYGWVLFAGVLLMVLATVNLIEGLAAVSNSPFFIRGGSYITGSLHTWGWVVTVIGTCEYLVGFAVLLKNQLSRWAGVVILGLNAVVQLLLIPAYPFWSLAVFALDVLAIYGLVVYGARIADS